MHYQNEAHKFFTKIVTIFAALLRKESEYSGLDKSLPPNFKLIS